MSAALEQQIIAVGAGRMGRGIAQVFAFSGFPVVLVDAKTRSADEFNTLASSARAEIKTNLGWLANAGVFDSRAVDTILQRIELVAKPAAARHLPAAAVVFECVPEVMESKRETFAFIEPLVDRKAIIASTTSTFVTDSLAEMLRYPDRFLNAHWLNPAFLVPLVELSPAVATNAKTVETLRGLLTEIGKVPVVCKATPGYIVPRIQALAMNEAARMVEQGVASPEDIDKAIRYGFGFRFAALGMLEFIDWGGGDILYYASRYLQAALDDERFAPAPIVERNMTQNKLGLRTGAGFYNYDDVDSDRFREERLNRMLAQLQLMNAVPKRRD